MLLKVQIKMSEQLLLKYKLPEHHNPDTRINISDANVQ